MQLLMPDNMKTYPVIFQNSKECFRLTPEGEIEKEGIVITDDDSAVADLLRSFILVAYGLKIRPADRRVSE